MWMTICIQQTLQSGDNGMSDSSDPQNLMKSVEFVSTIGQDMRYGIRLLAKSPGFTAVAVLTLALGIGANTAIFSLIEAVLLRALPVQNPQRLVVLEWSANKWPKYGWYTSYSDTHQKSTASRSMGSSFSRPFIQKVEKAKIFDGVAAFAGGPPIAVSGNGPATIGPGQEVNGDFFRTLGVQAAAGRLLGAGDDEASAMPAVVLSYAYWQHNFAGSPSAIGKTINLNGVPFAIVGVAEAKFSNLSFGNVYDFWIPAAMTPRVRPTFGKLANDPTAWWMLLAGRLKPGTLPEQAQAALDIMFRNEVLHGDKPLLIEAEEPHIFVRGAQETLVGQSTQFADPLAVLMGVVGIVLLIACANVGGLVLSRATARRREIAVRLALGAARGRLLRQLLTEAMLLGLMGGAAGLVLAIWGANGIVAMLEKTRTASLGLTASIDLRVLAFTGGISLLAGIIFGLSPAWRSLRLDVTPALKARAGTPLPAVAKPHPWLTLGNGLVILQTALAVVVVMGAGLLVHTLSNLKKIDPGFDTRNILTFALQPGLAGYKLPQTDNLYRQLKEDISVLPGVVSVGYSEAALLIGGTGWTTRFKYLPPGASQRVTAHADEIYVGPDFLSTLKIPIVVGRSLHNPDFAQAVATNLAEDTAKPGTPPAAVLSIPLPVVVNQEFARKYYPGVNPLGQIFGQDDGSDPDYRKGPGYVIIGIASDAKYNTLRRSIAPAMYLPMAGNRATFEVRTAGDPRALIPALRSLLERHDKNLPITNVCTQEEYIDMLLSRERLVAELSGLFAVLALVIACVGLYGLLSFEVVRRTREIGIRMALGSRRSNLAWLVVSHGMALVLLGTVTGIAGALALGRVLTGLLYGVKPSDPTSLIASAVLLIAVALAGAFMPARRATRVDPMVALRCE